MDLRMCGLRWGWQVVRGTIVAGALCSVTVAGAQTPVPLGDPFQVNTYTTDFQLVPSVAADADGDFVVVWASAGSATGTSSYTIQGQRYASGGTPLGGEFQVNTYTTDDQSLPSVAADADGDFVVVWSNVASSTPTDSDDIRGQRYASDGTALGSEFQVNTYTTSRQIFPRVAAAADGDFVVVWQTTGSSGSGERIQGQRYASDGTPLGGEFQVNTYTTDIRGNPSVATAADGGFVVVWDSRGSSGSDTSDLSIQGQRYAPDGTALGGEFQVNTYTTGTQIGPRVAASDDGAFAVVWLSRSTVPSDDDAMQGQRFSSNGTPLGSEFQVGSPSAYLDPPSVGASADGGFIVAWKKRGQIQGSEGLAQRYAADGTALGSEFEVIPNTHSLLNFPELAVADDGRFVVAWGGSSYETDSDETSILARLFAPSGNQPPVAQCRDVAVHAVAGQCSAEATSVDDGSFDPDGDPITLEQSPPAPYAIGSRTVTLTARDPLNETGSCAGIVACENQPPVVRCKDVTVPAEAGACSAAASIDDGSSDPDGDTISLEQDPAGPHAVGTMAVQLTATDSNAASSTCAGDVTVEDTQLATIACNTPATIVPPASPVSFSATASDNCAVTSIEIASYDCFGFTKKGKRVNRGCSVSLSGDTITISDTGGLGDHVSWTVVASDANGNESSETCEVVVVNPAQ